MREEIQPALGGLEIQEMPLRALTEQFYYTGFQTLTISREIALIHFTGYI